MVIPMFKKNAHGLFCYCNYCRARRRNSVFYNIIISAILLITLYQGIIILFSFTRFNCFLLLLEIIASVFIITRTLF